ncbi:MAG: magnesium/cobalt transporter CorA [Deltaproteobacteria bacterium]|nr:magnesium/cobalt transporter CorA [Deltaproteobacteria bacterium]
MSRIVNCAEYADGHRVGDVHLTDVSEVLGADRSRFVWMGLHEPDEALLREVQHEFRLHDLAVEDAHRAHQRPKLEEYGDALFVVLRTAQRDPEGKIAFGETHLFVGPGYVVSVRHGASVPYVDVRQRCESAPHLLKKGPGFVLYALMDFVVDNYFPIVDELEEELEKLEENIFGGNYRRETTENIYDLKRVLLRLKRAVSPLIDICNRLTRFDSSLIDADSRPYFRDVYDHVIRINETVDNLRELLNGALEANLSLISVQQNEVTKKLASWAAIIAVPTMVAGIYGMNFEHMPELGWGLGYPMALAIMVVACAMLYWQFRRAGWL